MKNRIIMKLLIVEDEPSLREIMVQTLVREQYVVEQAADYASASDKLAAYDYDCILLDIMLPDGSGLRLLEELKRRRNRAGVIIISARDSLDDKIEGLEPGSRRLSSEAVSPGGAERPDPERAAPPPARRLREPRRGERAPVARQPEGGGGGRPLELLRKEYDILHYFMTRPNHTVDKAALAEGVWGDHIDQVDNFDFVYAQMKNLRRKLHDAGADIEIRAVYGFGYMARSAVKLVYRILLHLSWVLSLLLAGWAALFYFAMIDRDQRRDGRRASKRVPK